jgi:hypothetical protein
MTNPLTDDEWVQFALWAHRNPIEAEHAGTLRLMGVVKELQEHLATMRTGRLIAEQQRDHWRRESSDHQETAALLRRELPQLSIPPATDPPREAVQKAELDAIHERFWSSVAPEAVHPDSVRLDWWLLDSQPDGFGEHSIWDLVPPDEMDDAAYLRAARAAMDAAAMQAPQAQETK